MDKKLLDILVCPVCKGKLVYQKKASELICPVDRLAYPIREGILVMLEEHNFLTILKHFSDLWL